MLGNDTLDFDYYNSVERYDQYVPKRTTCYIDRTHRGAQPASIAATVTSPLAACHQCFCMNAGRLPLSAQHTTLPPSIAARRLPHLYAGRTCHLSGVEAMHDVPADAAGAGFRPSLVRVCADSLDQRKDYCKALH